MNRVHIVVEVLVSSGEIALRLSREDYCVEKGCEKTNKQKKKERKKKK